MADPALDIPSFRLAFPAFASMAQYPDATISLNWDMATAFLGARESYIYVGTQQQTALNLLTAHLLALAIGIASGSTSSGGAVTSATIDKVSVTMTAPTTDSGWQFWLSGTPYGMQLWALLSMIGAGGRYIGGSPERFGFRRVGGGFGPPW